MNGLRPFGFAFALGVVVGCGPMLTPMPDRLGVDDQKKVDDAWERVLSGERHYDRQALLDLLLCTHAYQCGVDELYFRSTKRISGGSVVMEVHYDRAAPNGDRFEIKVLDLAGNTVRQESYDREEVRRTERELLQEYEVLRKHKQQGTASPEDLTRLAAFEARVAVVQKVFPEYEKQEQRKKEGAKKKGSD